MHETLSKFGYPQSCLFEAVHWTVLLRPVQVTPGSLVLVHKDANVVSLGAMGAAAGAELPTICERIEQTLKRCLGARKFNYLSLMMKDPQVHFHVLPRYDDPVSIAGRLFEDPAWPGPPDITRQLAIGAAEMSALHEMLTDAFQQPSKAGHQGNS